MLTLNQVVLGDCVTVMAGMEPDSIDAIVTDPPAGISFMSKTWDKPGTLGVSGGVASPTTTASRNPSCRTCGGRMRAGPATKPCSCDAPDWNDAAYRQRDRDAFVAWLTGVMRECYRVLKPGHWMLCWALPRTSHWTAWAIEDAGFYVTDCIHHVFAQGFPKGRGQLKPAYEPWWLARKPGPLRELAIDECRIGVDGGTTRSHQAEFQHDGVPGSVHATRGYRTGHDIVPVEGGRWPANVVLSDAVFDGGWEGVVGGGAAGSVVKGDTGTYSRFFLVPKASRADREPLVPGELEAGFSPTMGNGIGGREHDPAIAKAYRRNTHPTVKPTALMRHLIRLVTPRGGVVLDPFLGSGTTALAARAEGFDWVGIEKDPEYVAIAEQRLVVPGFGL